MPFLLAPDPPRVRALLALPREAVAAAAGEALGAVVIRRWGMRASGFGCALAGPYMACSWDLVDVVGGGILVVIAIGLWEASGRAR